MRVGRPLLQLPIKFDASRLAAEVSALPSASWCPHPQGYVGNEAVPLVSRGGGINDDFIGAMGPTENLERCPYIMSMMKELDGVWGRSRLMGLAGGADVPRHADLHYYWRTHLRIHVPVITNPGVVFTVKGASTHMAAGECWVFDSFEPHQVQNKGSERRVHLVLDTVGSERLWDLLEEAQSSSSVSADVPVAALPPAKIEDLRYEQLNSPIVMSPWEIQQHLSYLFDRTPAHPLLTAMGKRIDRFVVAWRAVWAEHGNSDAGFPAYHALIEGVRRDLNRMGADQIRINESVALLQAIEFSILRNALNPSLATATTARLNQEGARTLGGDQSYRRRVERPIFLVGNPRSGATVLFEALAKTPGVYSAGEAHALVEGIETLSVQARGWSSNRLTAEDATDATAEQLSRSLYLALRDRDSNAATGAVRMLEKTPKNALRVPFFDAIWPDTTYVFVYRDPRQSIASMIEAWLTGRFVTYPTLPGWTGNPWSLLLVPRWRELIGLSVAEVAARQWKATMEILLHDLSMIPKERLYAVNYDELIASPNDVIAELADSLGLEWESLPGRRLPLSPTTVSKPIPNKWRRIEQTIDEIWPLVEETDRSARDFINSLRTPNQANAA